MIIIILVIILNLTVYFTAAYVSLETVVIEDTGRVTYKAVPEDKELEVVFLAPELQQFGIVTEKVRHISVLLVWLCPQ